MWPFLVDEVRVSSLAVTSSKHGTSTWRFYDSLLGSQIGLLGMPPNKWAQQIGLE